MVDILAMTVMMAVMGLLLLLLAYIVIIVVLFGLVPVLCPLQHCKVI